MAVPAFSRVEPVSNSGPVIRRISRSAGMGTWSAGTHAEVNSSFAINLYPNPANNILHVSLANPAANVSFKIFNSVGQIVDSKTFNTGAENLNVDISKLNSGVYRIVFSLNNNNTVSCGFIKE